MSARNAISMIAFSRENFLSIIATRSGDFSNTNARQQAFYIASYLDRLGAQSLLVEAHYIDRHFMEEAAFYHSRSLKQKPNYCVRIHAFAEDISDDVLGSILQSATTDSDELNKAQSRLQEAYLGFIVVRPLPAVPIGRTVLKYLDDIQERKFPISQPYTVHVAGFELVVQGLAFQQQDRAVAACATTAIWSALQCACRREGKRTPVPPLITQAAVQHFVPEGRPFPSSGLRIEQISEAFRSFDFPPEFLRVGTEPTHFMLQLGAYLRSGIPVLLAIVGNVGGHAVTAVGYRESGPPRPYKDSSRQLEFLSHNLRYQKIYIHDDRIGPYARGTLRIDTSKIGNLTRVLTRDSPLRLEIDIELPGMTKTEEWGVEMAMVPLYPKLRTSVSELYDCAMGLLTLLRGVFAGGGENLELEIFFARSGGYQKSLYSMPIDPLRIPDFQRQLVLSRYVGVMRWYRDGEFLLDAVWDTTDLMRETRWNDNLIALVSFSRSEDALVQAIGSLLSVPVC